MSPFLDRALQLRIWDDQAKQGDLPTPGLAVFREDVRASLLDEFANWSIGNQLERFS